MTHTTSRAEGAQIELLPCPFCNQPDHAQHLPNCWFLLRDIGASRGRLAEAWNRRATQQASAAPTVVQMLREAADIMVELANSHGAHSEKSQAWMERALPRIDVMEASAAPQAPVAGDDIVQRLREHDDARLYIEADVLMAEAANTIADLRAQLASAQESLSGMAALLMACAAEFPLTDDEALRYGRAIETMTLRAVGAAQQEAVRAAPDDRTQTDAEYYRLLRDAEKVPGFVWAALEAGEGVDEAMATFKAIKTPIPFCDPCKAGRFNECEQVFPCTLPVHQASAKEGAQAAETIDHDQLGNLGRQYQKSN